MSENLNSNHNIVNNNATSFDDEPKKLGTRVFKKSSPNGKVSFLHHHHHHHRLKTKHQLL
jgi:beta-arrestin